MRMYKFSELSIFKRRALPTRFARSLTALVIAAAPLAVLPTMANAVSDSTPMHFTSLSASTNEVNVNNGDARVDMYGPTQDDLSGYGKIQFYYTSPSGAQVYEGSESFNVAGEFAGYVDFQQFAEPGTWKPTFTLSDKSGNTQTMTPDELTQAGYNMNVNVVSDTPDLTPPVLTAMNMGGSGLSLSDTWENFFMGVVVDDDRPGTVSVNGRFVSPSGNQVMTQMSSWVQEVNPNEHMLVPRFNPYSEAGLWQVFITVADEAGNTVSFDPDYFQQNFGNPMGIYIDPVLSDITPMTVNSAYFTMANEALPGEGSMVTVRADITDNLSGYADVTLKYRSQTSAQVSEYAGTSMTIEGTPNLYELNALLPPFAASGLWLPEITTLDAANNAQTLTHADLLALGLDLSINLGESVVSDVAASGTVTTDPGNTGATETQPVQAAIQTPVAGTVSIQTMAIDPNLNGMSGYLLLGQQVTIHAPEATVEAPLTITFHLDSTQVEPGQTAANLAVIRNGVLVEPCLDQTTANPTPCVFERNTLPGGDLEVKVHTVAASSWGLAFPVSQAHQFKGFKKPIKAAPKLNQIEAGEAVSVKFNFGDASTVNILANGSPTTQAINCTTLAPIGEATPALSKNGQGLKLNGNDRYKFDWKTLKSWKKSCRQLTFTFTNGEVASVNFKLKD